ncbi:hypothetical protein A1O1_02880 [Capronia coronata CBS 617.96]|uniref:Cupin type-1 domain-containing protein n=1 Tax=Capronia coronata CBS 617.96 TaxID=1182541 RepID=W9ZJ13_9EURO|nr:uncharacterized protein A1O1_02880 [Capronia coronata CBS 617.96]EXJ94484.1 hypothetical protein A1O1_02880 [Capronia coronata CBS 617.96]
MANFDYGFTLPDGTIIAHGEGVLTKQAFPPELQLPGTMHVFSPGHETDPSVPCFQGPAGILDFDTTCRMPRHVHMTTNTSKPQKFVTEKILVMNGVALAELSGTIYVIPPMTMVIIKPGSPHAWVACPPGVDFQKLGISGDEKLVSEGKFYAVYEYSDATTFFPTTQNKRLESVDDYVKCDDLQSIRFPELDVEGVIKRGTFVWGKTLKKLS